MASLRPTSATALALVAVFAAVTAAFALVPGMPIGHVPITLPPLAVALTGMVLGPLRGFLATALYLLVGFAGLPVFAGGAAGLGVLGKPSIGYLLSFPVAALVTGALARVALARRRLLPRWLFLSVLTASVLVIHPACIVGLIRILPLDLAKAIAIDLPFWPGDLA